LFSGLRLINDPLPDFRKHNLDEENYKVFQRSTHTYQEVDNPVRTVQLFYLHCITFQRIYALYIVNSVEYRITAAHEDGKLPEGHKNHQ
jgi:hypothetical protein